MKFIFKAMIVIALSFPGYGLAVVPVSVVKGPPASLKMLVHKFGVHEFYLTRPARPLPNFKAPMKITLTRGSVPNQFQVEIVHSELPSGEIYFRVDIPLGDESGFEIHAVEMASRDTWYEVFSGKLSEIPSEFQ